MPNLEEELLQDSPPNLSDACYGKVLAKVISFIKSGIFFSVFTAVLACICGTFTASGDGFRLASLKNVCSKPLKFWHASSIGLWEISLSSLRMDIRRAPCAEAIQRYKMTLPPMITNIPHAHIIL